MTDDLLVEIERVIFDSWPVESRQGTSNFKELLEIRLQSARARRRAELEAVGRVSDDILELRVLQQNLPVKQHELSSAEAQEVTLRRQQEGLVGQKSAVDTSRIQAVGQALEAKQQQAQSVERRATTLRSLLAAVDAAESSTFPGIHSDLKNRHALAGLKEEEWSQFAVKFVGDVHSLINQALASADAELLAISGTASSAASLVDVDVSHIPTRSLVELSQERRRLEDLLGLDRQRTDLLTKTNNQLAAMRSKLERLRQDVKDGEEAGEKINDLNRRRAERYAAYFDALLEEADELSALYAPLSALIQASGESVARLRFAVKRSVDIAAWARRGEDLLDLRTAGPFRGAGELERVATAELLPAWLAGDGASTSAAITEFSSKHSESLRRHAAVSKKDVNAYRTWERAVSRWLYGADHVTLAYDIDYDGISVDRLSPGTRGIVLLLLYLAIDQQEADPLIIDQPEENLDPESVYSELVSLFREASSRRQIIMVTHNANLVVNTDVDQVIIARSSNVEAGHLPTLSYTAGGLENPDIRRSVCEVLEGGAQAFRERARRLGLELIDQP